MVFFLPAFISPFMPTALSKFVLLIDVIFSYLYVLYIGFVFHLTLQELIILTNAI